MPVLHLGTVVHISVQELHSTVERIFHKRNRSRSSRTCETPGSSCPSQALSLTHTHAYLHSRPPPLTPTSTHAYLHSRLPHAYEHVDTHLHTHRHKSQPHKKHTIQTQSKRCTHHTDSKKVAICSPVSHTHRQHANDSHVNTQAEKY